MVHYNDDCSDDGDNNKDSYDDDDLDNEDISYDDDFATTVIKSK
jgi:hypothetical protein